MPEVTGPSGDENDGSMPELTLSRMHYIAKIPIQNNRLSNNKNPKFLRATQVQNDHSSMKAAKTAQPGLQQYKNADEYQS